MTTPLLDANVLIALVVKGHEHEAVATDWLSTVRTFAVCPIVEGALVRYLLRTGESAATAAATLASIRGLAACGFWPDDLSYTDIDLTSVRGYRQVTDRYLLALAAAHGGLLATFDEGLLAEHPRDTVRPGLQLT